MVFRFSFIKHVPICLHRSSESFSSNQMPANTPTYSNSIEGFCCSSETAPKIRKHGGIYMLWKFFAFKFSCHIYHKFNSSSNRASAFLFPFFSFAAFSAFSAFSANFLAFSSAAANFLAALLATAS